MRLGWILFIFFIAISTAQAKLIDSLAQDYMSGRNDCEIFYQNIYVCANDVQKKQVRAWFKQIQTTAIGAETVSVINSSGHIVAILHEPKSVSSAGRTLAPLTSALTDGRGADVVIEMNMDIPLSGSHRVVGEDQPWIEFTALQNFMHELSHARHKMSGTWLMTYSEGQAILDENVYRAEEAQLNGTPVHVRSISGYEDGQQIWFP